MWIGVHHNAGCIDCMYEVDMYKRPSSTLDLTNMSNLVFWLKKPQDLKQLCADLSFEDPFTNGYVFRDVMCNIEYKLYYVPNGHLLKQLPHILSGCIGQHDGSTLVQQDRKLELYYNPKLPAYCSIPRDLYDENEIVPCVFADREYKDLVNKLLPSFYI